MRVYHSAALVALALASLACSGGDAATPPPAAAFDPCVWTPWPANPVIASGWTAAGDLLVNDPCVIAEGAGYRMWYSKGSGLGINHVKVYEGASADGVSWTLDPAVLVESNSDVTVTGTLLPDVAGIFALLGENTADFTNGRPAFELQAGGWFLWYDPAWLHYRLSDALGGDGSASWLGSGGTIIDGAFAPHSGAASGAADATSDWDSEKVETPMVLRVGATYHLYYSGFKIGDAPGAYDTGHATSPDGTVWTKDPNNPVLTGGSDPTQFGFYQVAEPGVVFNPVDSLFYAYYVTARDRGPLYTGTDLGLQQGIAVATSSDGSSFSFQQMALVQSAAYPVSMGYVGYSTPFGLIDSAGTFHLFYDVAAYPGPGDWRQVALAHATSADGLTFTEVETDILVYQDVPWRMHEVRAPCVIEENGIFKMWFAGSNSLFFQPGFTYDIGYVTSDKVCR